MAYIPSSKTTIPFPTSPSDFWASNPPPGGAPAPADPPTPVDRTTVTANPPSRADRRERIAEQVEEQINRQIGSRNKKGVDFLKRINKPEQPEIEPPEWTDVRGSKAPRDLIARDAYNRKRGWERGKNEENYFARKYRRDANEIPYFNGRHATPKNSQVSDVQYWRSKEWLRPITKRPKNLSALKGVVNNPELMASLKRAQEEVSQEERFLNASHPILGAFWKGVKVLGRGGQGIVGLWEYVGPGTHIWGRRIVIKQSLQNPLDEERDAMMEMGHGDSGVTHAVQLLYPIVVDRKVTPQVFRIILEFCEGGDLDSLIIQQRNKKEHFTEENLWQFFECFAKGLNIMDHANESPERKQDSRHPICHFDIKPLNILRGEMDDEHKFLPICKIADFGLAAHIDPINYTQFARSRGTSGYYAPEQFSSRWAYRDAERCGHINVYGTHTNIWQIGCLMYMLATLRGPPRPKGFRCSAIGKKFTYGYKLHQEKLSKALKSLIWRCLCDKPKDRPDLITLHREIANALNAIKSRPYTPQQNLDPPEPQAPQEPEAPSKGPPPEKRIEIPIKDKGTEAIPAYKGGNDNGAKARPKDAATGTRTAPFIVPGGTKVLRRHVFMFCVVPKHVPEGKQEPIWFQATPDSTLRGLKDVIRNDAGLNLADDKQLIYLRLPNQPVLLMENMARMLSLYGVGQGTRLELWDDKDAHNAAEPEEPEFDVL